MKMGIKSLGSHWEIIINLMSYTDEISLMEIFPHGELIFCWSSPLKKRKKEKWRGTQILSLLLQQVLFSPSDSHFLSSHQLSSWQVYRRQQEDRVQPGVCLHLPSFLLYLHILKEKVIETKNENNLLQLLIIMIMTEDTCEKRCWALPLWFCQPQHLRPHR